MNDTRLRDAYRGLMAEERAAISIHRFKDGEGDDHDLRRTAPPDQIDAVNAAFAVFNQVHQQMGWFSLLQEERLTTMRERVAFLAALAGLHCLAEETLRYVRGDAGPEARASLVHFAERIVSMADVTVDDSLAFASLEHLCGSLFVVHEELLAAEAVVSERTADLYGEEPLHPETRKRLNEIAQTIPALAARAREHGVEPVLPEQPGDGVVSLMRRLTEVPV